MYSTSVSGTQEIRLKIVLTKDITPLMLSIFFTTLILTTINQYTNFFNTQGMFEVILSVNATILMTLTSLFISTLNSLPMTTYIKMIEVWLFVNFLYPFVIITVHTLIFVIGKETKKKDLACRALELFGKYVLPVCFALFTVVYFSVGLSQRAMIVSEL